MTLYFPEEFTTDMLADDSVTAEKLCSTSGSEAVVTDVIRALSITNAKVATLAIGNTNLIDAAVTGAKIANLSISTDHMVDLMVTAGKLANGSVESTKIASLAVGTAAIALLAVGSAQIANSAIVEAKIDDLAVTNAKIASLDVGKLTAGTISSKLITLAVTGGTGDTAIRAGKTDFDNKQAGFILGLDDSDSDKPKFYLGDSTKYLSWDGSALTVRGTLTADDITAGTLDVARLSSGSIETIKLDTNAATIPVSAYTAADIGSFEPNPYQTATITSTGAVIFITVSCRLTNCDRNVDQFADVRIYRGGTLLANTFCTVISSWPLGYSQVSVSISDTPGAGTFSYYLYVYGNNLNIGLRSILLLEAKR